jgi:SAM-dependent methyltransferase
MAETPTRAAYDAIADWYAAYVNGPAAAFTARAGAALGDLLGPGEGPCWDMACGTGVYAEVVADLGWSWFGTDLSARQLGHVPAGRPVAVADASRPPLAPGRVAAAVSVLCHTDVDDYAAFCRAAASVLRVGGRFVHVGIHPCFCGAFADWSSRPSVVISPGYWRRERRYEAWTAQGVRARVGATHLPVAALLQGIVDAGLVIERVAEYGEPTPDVLAVAAVRRS